ncbi:MAG: ABC transporter ATP-binding protein [Nitrospiraceae bacterium]|nr:ABC transporter ATP-binding protein [Nitrospiraceae bacterium]
MASLIVKNITKSFRIDGIETKAVDDASMEIEKGQFVSIVGHSGSGKTTFLSIIGGILSPNSGSVYVDGQDVYRMNDDGLATYRATKIGYVFQFASLMPMLTSRENLLLPTVFSGLKRDANKRAERYMELVGLKDKLNSYPYQLSGGQQRRVAISRALMNEPELLLADEPTGDLDEQTEAEVMAFFMQVNREMGLTFILVTHNSALADTATRKFRMSNGRLNEV